MCVHVRACMRACACVCYISNNNRKDKYKSVPSLKKAKIVFILRTDLAKRQQITVSLPFECCAPGPMRYVMPFSSRLFILQYHSLPFCFMPISRIEQCMSLLHFAIYLFSCSRTKFICCHSKYNKVMYFNKFADFNLANILIKTSFKSRSCQGKKAD